MNIDYKNGRITSKQVDFDGETEDGRTFTIDANWNDWDGWSVDGISWDDEEGSPEEEEEIKEKFLADMN
jgi:hypothetical protein